MGTKFPLCESVGLSPLPVVDQSTWNISSEIFINAKAVEALLAKGVRVYSEAPTENMYQAWVEREPNHSQLKRQALLIDIKPIAKPERRRELSESEVRKTFEGLAVLLPGFVLDEGLRRLFGEEFKGE